MVGKCLHIAQVIQSISTCFRHGQLDIKLLYKRNMYAFFHCTWSNFNKRRLIHAVEIELNIQDEVWHIIAEYFVVFDDLEHDLLPVDDSS